MELVSLRVRAMSHHSWFCVLLGIKSRLLADEAHRGPAKSVAQVVTILGAFYTVLVSTPLVQTV